MHQQNNTGYIVTELETTAKSLRLVSPIGDESPSRRSLPILPDVLIVEILLRLPVRYLIQFKCVCKSWKTLISDPQFVKSHFQISTAEQSLTHQRLLFSVSTEPFKIVSYPLKPLYENQSSTPIKPDSFNMRHEHNILGSCNGLFCLYDINQCCVTLWNPSTRLTSKRSPIVYESDNLFIANHGFGYDQINDKYKVLVVVVLNVNNYRKTVTRVYTFGEDYWRTIKNLPFTRTTWLGKFVNGTLNWFAKEGVNYNQWGIISFDVEKETHRKLSLPKQNEGDNICNPVLDVLSNCLCVCFESNKTNRVIWLMKQYGIVESWTKLMIISRHKFIKNGPAIMSFDELLFISENGVILVKNKLGKLILLNSDGGLLHYPSICNKLGLDLHIYCESLLSPQY